MPIRDLNDPAFADARAALVAARRHAAPIASWLPAWQPTDAAAAWALQASVLAEFGEVVAWKVGGATAEQRNSMAIERAVGAAIPRAFVHDAASIEATAPTLELSNFIAPLIECEFAFRLARDLPRRSDRDWTRAEVDAATGTMHPAFEIVDPRLPRGSGTLAEVADGFNNGALVIGPAIADWRALDLAAIEIILEQRREGEATELARGSAQAVCAGDPFAAVLQLANAQPASAPGLRAGDVITTGSCTGAPRIPGAGRCRARYGALGAVEAVFR